MDQVHVIRHKVLVEGVSRRQVAEEMGISRNTVRKYVSMAEPIGAAKAQKPTPVLDRISARLQELLEGWSGRTTKKQRLTASRLHRQLIKEGYSVGQTTVRSFVRQWRHERREVYVPLVHRPGEEAQVDFFEVTVELNGERQKRWMFLIRMMYSGRDFAWLYDRCDQVAFLDGHVRAFTHFGGVPGRCIYDNLKPAVKRVMFPGRALTQRFMAICSHYLFEPCFARVGTGHDKGGVEARGRGVRLQHLVPVPRGQALEAVSAELLASLDAAAHQDRDRNGRTVMDRFSEEAARLRPLPAHDFDPRIVVPLSISRTSLVTYDGATYSLPSHWSAAAEIMAYVGAVDIRFVHHDEILLRRRVQKRQKNIRYMDYLKELRKKPQAARQIAPELVAELGEPFGELWSLLEKTHGGKEAGRIFSRVLGAVVDHGEQVVGAALKTALKAGHRHLLALGALKRGEIVSSIEVPEPLRQFVVEAAQAKDFDVLLEVTP